MTKHFALVAALAFGLVTSVAAQNAAYYPDRFNWQRRTPQQEGFDAAKLDEAIKFAQANENPAPKDLAVAHIQSYAANEPFDSILGPETHDRAALNGLLIHHGYVVADWGDTKKVDMTFSVTKTLLTTVVGLAWQKGLIRDITDKAGDYMPPDVDLFKATHNQSITWEHLLRQSSDWSGTLWGKPDWADRPVGKPSEWQNRPMYEPGTPRCKSGGVRCRRCSATKSWNRSARRIPGDGTATRIPGSTSTA
jgi:CubicO group peptidase (beta-lactamase class C family)